MTFPLGSIKIKLKIDRTPMEMCWFCPKYHHNQLLFYTWKQLSKMETEMALVVLSTTWGNRCSLWGVGPISRLIMEIIWVQVKGQWMATRKICSDHPSLSSIQRRAFWCQNLWKSKWLLTTVQLLISRAEWKFYFETMKKA